MSCLKQYTMVFLFGFGFRLLGCRLFCCLRFSVAGEFARWVSAVCDSMTESLSAGIRRSRIGLPSNYEKVIKMAMSNSVEFSKSSVSKTALWVLLVSTNVVMATVAFFGGYHYAFYKMEQKVEAAAAKGIHVVTDAYKAHKERAALAAAKESENPPPGDSAAPKAEESVPDARESQGAQEGKVQAIKDKLGSWLHRGE